MQKSTTNRIQYYIKEIIAGILIFALYDIMKDAGMLKYMVLIGAAGVLFLYGYSEFEKEYLVFAVPSAVYIGAGLLISGFTGHLTYQSFKETAFALIPLFAAIGFFSASKKMKIGIMKWQYWSMILLTLSLMKYFCIEDLLENQYAFVFGIFLLYYCLMEHDLKYIIITAVMMYLMNKRIAIVAVVFVLLIYELFMKAVRKKPEWEKRTTRFLSIGAIIVLAGYVILLCTIDLKGQFIQDLTSGRSSAWAAVKEQYQLSLIWPGRGLGDVINLLEKLQFPSFTTNLHNDLLKVFIEIGTLGYLLWIGSHFFVCHWISKKKNLSYKKTLFLYLIMLYTLLNYTTDNIMVYVNYWFPAYFILFTVLSSKEKSDTEENHVNEKERHLIVGVILVFSLCIIGNMLYVYAEYKDPSKFTIPEDAISVRYPDDGKTKVLVWLREGRPFYRVRYQSKNLIEPSILGVSTSEYSLKKDVSFQEVIYREVLEEDQYLLDEDNPIKQPYQSVMIEMEQDGYEVILELRAYDLGLAFRYILPEETDQYDDLTQFRFLQNSTLKIYDESQGESFADLSTEKIEKNIYRLPFTVYYENGSVLEVSENCDVDQKTSYVTKASWKKRTMDIEFYQEESTVKNSSVKTPWRVLKIQ